MTRYRFALAPAGLSGPQIREDTHGAGGRGTIWLSGTIANCSDFTSWLWHAFDFARSLQWFRACGRMPFEGNHCK